MDLNRAASRFLRLSSSKFEGVSFKIEEAD